MTDELDLDLARPAAALHIPAGDVEAVYDRARRRSARRHRALAAGTAMTMVAASVGIFASTRDGGKTREVQVGDNAIKRGDVGVRWERVDAKVALGFSPSIDGESGLVALSTAAGQREFTPQNRVIWRSDDGVEWTAVSTLGNDLYLSDLANAGSRIYAVGTGPASASVAGKRPVSDLLVGWSDDGATTWQHQQLPLDLKAIVARSGSAGVTSTQIASNDGATVAVVALRAEPDASVLPAGETAPHGWVLTDTGIDILGDGPACAPGTSPDERVPAGARAKMANEDPQPGARVYPSMCMAADGTPQQVAPQASRGVTAQYTWAQLGIDGDLLRAVRGEPFAFRAEAGSTAFERIDLGVATSFFGGQLLGDDTGFHLVGQRFNQVDPKATSELVLLESTDGVSWVQTPGPGGMTWATAMGQLGGRMALVGDGHSGPTLAVANGAGGWTTTSLRDAVDPTATKNQQINVSSAAIGPLGVVAAMVTITDAIAEAGGVAITKDGYTLTLLDQNWAAVVTDATGKEIARTKSASSSATGPLQSGDDGSIVLLDEATGQTLVRFSSDDLQAKTDALYGKSRGDVQTRLLTSRDGITWSDETVDSLAGTTNGNVIRVLMTGERAVVAVGGGPGRPQIALIGTPR